MRQSPRKSPAKPSDGDPWHCAGAERIRVIVSRVCSPEESAVRAPCLLRICFYNPIMEVEDSFSAESLGRGVGNSFFLNREGGNERLALFCLEQLWVLDFHLTFVQFFYACQFYFHFNLFTVTLAQISVKAHLSLSKYFNNVIIHL